MGFCVFVIIVNHIITQTHTIQSLEFVNHKIPQTHTIQELNKSFHTPSGITVH